MTKSGYCIEGRHKGTQPKHSKPCPGKMGKFTCSCTCHTEEAPKFARKRRETA